jgi:excisionase family DNA binding protein
MSVLMSTGGVALVCGVHRETVRRWAAQGLLPCHLTAGGHRRFRREDVLVLLARTDDR